MKIPPPCILLHLLFDHQGQGGDFLLFIGIRGGRGGGEEEEEEEDGALLNRRPIKVVYMRPLYFKQFFSNSCNVHIVQ